MVAQRSWSDSVPGGLELAVESRVLPLSGTRVGLTPESGRLVPLQLLNTVSPTCWCPDLTGRPPKIERDPPNTLLTAPMEVPSDRFCDLISPIVGDGRPPHNDLSHQCKRLIGFRVSAAVTLAVTPGIRKTVGSWNLRKPLCYATDASGPAGIRTLDTRIKSPML